MGSIGAIILAAGESKRMGFPKMLLPLYGKTMLENVIGNVAGSEVDEMIVVLGGGPEELKEIVKNMSAKYCYNENYTNGMLSSVQCGFRNISAELDAVLVFQGDQPFITVAVANRVIEAYKSSDKGIVIATYNTKRGHPILIDKKYRNMIEKLDASEGLRSLASLYPDDVLEIETDTEVILRDIDTFQDYETEINNKQ